jgi:hypothetical protein
MALEQGFHFQRVRRQAAVDRLLCRLLAEPDVPWLLKGGYDSQSDMPFTF